MAAWRGFILEKEIGNKPAVNRRIENKFRKGNRRAGKQRSGDVS